ncbi:MAG TPA: hypothetical protein PLD88_07385, partial [Candidatus Berkiella sp.]|nr:hypothetical protein [Candidatus Berkiella sp.]
MLSSPITISKQVRAYSAYARAINYLINGEEAKAREELEKLKEKWKESDINIDIDASIEKMYAEIKNLANNGLVFDKLGNKPNYLAQNAYVDNDYFHVRRVGTAEIKKAAPIIGGNSKHFIFNKWDLLNKGAISLSDLNDDEIFTGATPL